ncbi:MAG: HYR domain-containing protein [Bacteroidetes bacterium]|nr:HYR domain-containing protein [Bacteroidota bacterium]
MKKLLPFLIISFLAWLPTTDAQLTITGEDVTVCDNGTVSVDVSVTNFIDITSAQFAITWDIDVIAFTSVSNNMPSSALFNTTNAATGTLLFSWFDAIPPLGFTPPGPPVGSMVMFTINFNVVGDYSPDPDNFTNIPFGSAPGFPMEITNTSGIIPNGLIVLNPGSVTIDDTTDPVITCPANITVTAATGQNFAVVSYPAPVVTDNCGTATTTSAPASGSSFPVGTTTVNCTATDPAGNSAACSFTVTVNPAPPNPGAVIFTAMDVVLDCGDTLFDVPVRVKDFDQMTSAQFALVWDELVFDYTGFTDSIVATGHPIALYNDLNANNGEFRFSWFDGDGVPGEDLPDSTVIFTLHFTLLDENDLPDTIRFDSLPSFPVELSDTSGILAPGDYVFENSIVILGDTIAPVITCPVAQTLPANASCQATLPSYTGLATATDDCTATPDIVITQIPAAGTVISDTTQIMLIAEDEAGLKDTCTFQVNLVDVTPPTITCAADITQPNDLDSCNAVVTVPAPVASDNCVTVTVTNDLPAGNLFPVGTTTVTYTATDGSGNTATCEVEVTVEDTEAPDVACPADVSTTTNTGCTATGVVLGTATATDNCTANPAITNNAPSAFSVGITIVTWTAEDAAGNTATCPQEVKVTDDDAPVLVCPANITQDNDPDSCNAIVNWTVTTPTDNCGISTFTSNHSPGETFAVGPATTVTYTATDAAGNVTTCSFTVTVEDGQDPVLAGCPANVAQDNDLDSCNALITLVAPTASDNCGTVTITNNLPAGNLFPVGSTTVTYTATDGVGNDVTCQVTVTVNDTLAPVITCPADISQSTDAGDCTAVVTWATPTAVDNCANVTITCTPPSGTAFPVGDSTVVCIAEDASGNRDTCEFVVTVFDGEAPALDCPGDTLIVVPAGTVDTIINDIYLFFAGDNCGVDTIYYHFSGAIPSGGGDGGDASGTAFPVGTTTVTYFVEDQVGNIDSCSFDVTIEEEVVMTLTCSADQAIDNDANLCSGTASGVTATATPPTSIQEIFYEISGATVGADTLLDASGAYNVGISVVTFYAVSVLNDTLNCSVSVTVNDTLAPVFTNCPLTNQVLDNTIDSCGLVFSGAVVPVANDNCPGITYAYSPLLGSLLPLGVNTISATATDASGNSASCTYQLEVIDNQSPKILGCPGLPIATVNDPGVCGAVVSWPAVTAQDNCNLLSFTVAPLGSGDFFPVQTTTVTYTAVDNMGNVGICQFDVVVTDTEPPTLVCPGNQSPVNTDLNQCSAQVTWPQPVANDNCAVVSLISNFPQGQIFDVGTETITYTTTDAQSNGATCSFTVTVVDNQFPFIPGMPSDFTVDTDPGECGAIVSWTLPNFPLDNCGIESFTSTIQSGTFFNVGSTDVQYIAIDVNGNVTVETLTITVEDNTLPVMNCPANINLIVNGNVVTDPDGFLTDYQPVTCDHIELEFSGIIASDGCGISSLTQTAGLQSGSPFPIGATTMTFVATDNSGNQATCSFVINVLPSEVPPAMASSSEVCEGGDVSFTVGTIPGATYTWTHESGTTVANQPNFTLTNVTLSQAGEYTVLISLPYCETEYVVEIGVNPLPQPAITANDLLCSDGSVPLNLSASDAGNTGAVLWNWVFPDGSPHSGQNQTVLNPTVDDSGIYTVTVTDANGCSASVSELVIVSDGPTMPTLNGTTASACLGDQFTLFGQLFSGGSVSYHWYATPAAGSGLVQINNPIQSVPPTAPGTYTYHFYVVVDGCTSDTAEWVVNVEAAPNVVLGTVGQILCVDGTTDVTLTETGGQATSWQWFDPAGNPLPGNSPSLVLQDVTASTSGAYKVTASTNNGCETTATIQVTITNAPSQAAQLFASATAVCDDGSVTLTGTPYPSGTTYLWTGANLPPFPQNLSSITVQPGQSGTYTFGALVNGCPTDVVSIDIVVEDSPTVSITVNGDVTCVDGTTSIQLVPNASSATSWEWKDEDDIVVAMTETLVLVNVNSSNSGTYTLTASTDIGCSGSGNIQVDITNALTGLTASVLGTSCEDGTLVFEASTIAGATYQWFRNNGNFSNVQNPTIPNATLFDEGTYQVVALLNGCADTASVVVDLLSAPTAVDEFVLGNINIPQSFNVVVNDLLDANEPYTINILNQPLNGTVTYDGDGVLTFYPNTDFWGTDNMVYQICYINCPDLCDIATVSLEIVDDKECLITTVITPNGDGINDIFEISCVGSFPKNTLIVFNQWGDKVYDAAPYENDWQGTYEGRDLPDGTYFFIFQRDHGEPAQKGFVMIYR